MNDAETVLKNINIKAAELAETDSAFEMGFARLGWMILEAAEMRYWVVRYDTFRDYLKTVAQIAHRSTAQLQQYFLTVRDLSMVFSQEELERIGITKAIKLRHAKDYAIVLPPKIIEAALDSTVTAGDLKKLISTELKMPDDPGDWMDLEMEFMVSAEQRALVEQAVDVAMHTEPLTKAALSKSQQMLDVMTKFSQEFLGAHNGDGN